MKETCGVVNDIRMSAIGPTVGPTFPNPSKRQMAKFNCLHSSLVNYVFRILVSVDDTMHALPSQLDFVTEKLIHLMKLKFLRCDLISLLSLQVLPIINLSSNFYILFSFRVIIKVFISFNKLI